MKRIVIDETKCDGCGLCVVGCHEGALAIVEGKARLVKENFCDGLGSCIGECPQKAISFVSFESSGCPEKKLEVENLAAPCSPTQRRQWPVQFRLVAVGAPFLENADLLICADCVPFALADFYPTLLSGKVVLVGCPKFDDVNAYLEKLTTILQERNVRSVTTARMEVPCCSGLTRLVRLAVERASKRLPYNEVIVGTEGGIVSSSGPFDGVSLL